MTYGQPTASSSCSRAGWWPSCPAAGPTSRWSPLLKDFKVSNLTDQRAVPVAVDVPTRRTGPKLARFRDLALIPFILLLLLVGFIVSPTFLTVDNMTAVLQQCTELSLLVL